MTASVQQGAVSRTGEALLEVRDYAQLTTGAIIIAIAIDSFLIPNRVVAGCSSWAIVTRAG